MIKIWISPFSKKFINSLIFIISAIIFIAINFFYIFFKNFDFNATPIYNLFKNDKFYVEISSNINNKQKENILNNNTNDNSQNNPSIGEKTTDKNIELFWKLKIPSISLEAPIAEGTDSETINSYIGHFSETSLTYGNIGLAAHNRGYPVNYFSDLKNLKKDDEIIYQYKNFYETYLVEKNVIIKDTDWSYLKNTQENTITLITCVENEPNYRRCIYGIEK